MPRRLTPRQERFVQEYVGNGYNATRAVLAVYKQTYSAARVTGSRLLTNANIQQAVRTGVGEYNQADIQRIAHIHRALLDSENPWVALRAIKMAYKVLGVL